MKFLKWLGALAVVGIAGYLAYVFINPGTSTGGPGQAEGEAIIPVRVVKIGLGDISRDVKLTGEVRAFSSVRIFSKIPGRIEKLPVDEGDPVTKGQVLAVIDHEALKARVKQAEAGLAMAKAQAASVAVNLKNLKTERKRMRGLYKEKVIARQRLDAIETQYDSTAAQFEAMQSQVEQAQAALEAAQIQLGEATVKATINGVVSKKYVDQGGTASLAGPLFELVQLDPLKVVGGISERHLADLAPGRTLVRVSTDAYPGESFTGELHRVGVTVDSRTRTVEVEVHVANRSRRLKPGMFARLTLTLERKRKVPIILRAALLREGAATYVFVANKGKARRRAITLGLSQQDRYEVKRGLSPGDLVIVTGQRQVKDGAEVTIIE